jgi:hypothetical protein
MKGSRQAGADLGYGLRQSVRHFNRSDRDRQTKPWTSVEFSGIADAQRHERFVPRGLESTLSQHRWHLQLGYSASARIANT